MSNPNQSIFESLKNGETISPNHPDRKQLREASFATIKLVQKLNNSANPEEIIEILSEITDTKIDETVAVFPPLYINYGKNLTLIMMMQALSAKDTAAKMKSVLRIASHTTLIQLKITA